MARDHHASAKQGFEPHIWKLQLQMHQIEDGKVGFQCHLTLQPLCWRWRIKSASPPMVPITGTSSILNGGHLVLPHVSSPCSERYLLMPAQPWGNASTSDGWERATGEKDSCSHPLSLNNLEPIVGPLGGAYRSEEGTVNWKEHGCAPALMIPFSSHLLLLRKRLGLTQHLSLLHLHNWLFPNPPPSQRHRLRKRRKIRGEITGKDSRHYCPGGGGTWWH